MVGRQAAMMDADCSILDQRLLALETSARW